MLDPVLENLFLAASGPLSRAQLVGILDLQVPEEIGELDAALARLSESYAGRGLQLVEIAGGDPIFPELNKAGLARDRIVTSEQIIARAPEVIIGSWCGKPVRAEKIAARPGWSDVPAVRNGHIYEVKSTYILQPGPAALTEGVRRLHDVIRHAVASR